MFGVMAEARRLKVEAQRRPISEYIDLALHRELSGAMRGKQPSDKHGWNLFNQYPPH